MRTQTDVKEPIVSVVMAAFNVSAYVNEALRSVRQQSLAAIEIVVVDDQSTDETPGLLDRHASEDARIRILRGQGRGPAAARNLAIAQARGRWIAVVDADDLIAPERLEQMIAEAERHNVDAVADNMTAFYEAGGLPDHSWIAEDVWPIARPLGFQDMMASGLGNPPAPELGYLKPVLRRDRLLQLFTPYREDLMIGEDFDLMARWTAMGFTYRYLPQTTYRYRRRASSLSYRLSADQIRQMIEALDSLGAGAPHFEPSLVERRKAELNAGYRYAMSVSCLKQGDLSAARGLLLDADSRRRFVTSIREGLVRRAKRLRLL